VQGETHKMEEEFKKDLEILESEIIDIQNQLANVNSQRSALATRAQQLAGAAGYLRGKLNIDTPPEDTVEKVEEKSSTTTEEKSEA